MACFLSILIVKDEVWVGTEKEGIYKIQNDSVTYFNSTNSDFNAEGALCLEEDKRLCMMSEMLIACIKNPAGVNNISDNDEWFDQFYSANGAFMSAGNCYSVNTIWTQYEKSSRCCK